MQKSGRTVFLIFFVTGSYLENAGNIITKPGHGGGAIQLVAKKGSIVIGI